MLRETCILRFSIFFVFLLIPISLTFAEPPQLKTLNEFSPNPIQLEWTGAGEDKIESVTPMIFMRPAESATAPWTQIEANYNPKDMTALIHAEHGETLQFRSAFGDEAILLGDFNKGSQLRRVNPAVLVLGHTMKIALERENAIEGKASLRFSFIYNGTQSNEEFTDNNIAGISFNKQIQVSDWSEYRYLEFSYQTDCPEAIQLRIHSASKQVHLPLHEYSPNGKEPNVWHTLSLDLNEIMYPPEVRKNITMCVFTIPMREIDVSEFHHISLDAVSLWKSKTVVQTTVDTTPPTAPASLQAQWLGPGRVRISWEPSKDDLSGIQGYSYVFTPSLTEQPNQEVDTQNNQMEIPIKPRSFYESFYLRMKAQNGAGMWSEVSKIKVPYYPKQFGIKPNAKMVEKEKPSGTR